MIQNIKDKNRRKAKHENINNLQRISQANHCRSTNFFLTGHNATDSTKIIPPKIMKRKREKQGKTSIIYAYNHVPIALVHHYT